MIISLVAIFILGYGLWKDEKILAKAGLWLNVSVLVFSILMYFSGSGTEESIKGMEHVNVNYLDRHKNFARITFLFSVIQGAVAIATIFFFRKRHSKFLSKALFAITCLAFVLFSITAHYGARISHPQLRILDKILFEKNRMMKKNLIYRLSDNEDK